MKILNIATIIALACQVPCGPARAQERGSRAIAGTWALQSIYEENDGGQDLDRWGARPTGHFIADAAGHFSFQLVGRGAIRLASASSPACSARSDREALAYVGTYAVDPEQGTITLRIEDATAAGWERSRPNAAVTVGGDRLDFVSSAETSPTGAFYTHLVWKRIN